MTLLHTAYSVTDGVVDGDWGTVERSESPLEFKFVIGLETGVGLLFLICAFLSF
ncbi:MAG TPA: hypothetical protein VIT38_03180 [Allosphingosinicella sp.]